MPLALVLEGPYFPESPADFKLFVVPGLECVLTRPAWELNSAIKEGPRILMGFRERTE